ncbi:hypothetical protein I3843_08G062900 [Carya illinoinensis]|nr:hypothetical protein I3843_08G062900 [Carya illinoinensis]
MMDEAHGHGIGSSSSNVDTAKAERSVWLMKCPVVVAKSWQSHPHSDPHPLAKVVLSLDPLHPDDSSSLQVLFLFLFSVGFYLIYSPSPKLFSETLLVLENSCYSSFPRCLSWWICSLGWNFR